MEALTDYLLLRLHADPPATACATHRVAWNAGLGLVYAYLRLPFREMMDRERAQELAGTANVSRLQLAMDLPGHSAGQAPACHYVVEMDPEAGWREELERWYDSEHMPGLAAVPGCVRAMRFLNHDEGPSSLACYDLVTADAPLSEPWLAVRGTPWSSHCRPHFTNTRRTMFDVVA